MYLYVIFCVCCVNYIYIHLSLYINFLCTTGVSHFSHGTIQDWSCTVNVWYRLRSTLLVILSSQPIIGCHVSNDSWLFSSALAACDNFLLRIMENLAVDHRIPHGSADEPRAAQVRRCFLRRAAMNDQWSTPRTAMTGSPHEVEVFQQWPGVGLSTIFVY